HRTPPTRRCTTPPTRTSTRPPPRTPTARARTPPRHAPPPLPHDTNAAAGARHAAATNAGGHSPPGSGTLSALGHLRNGFRSLGAVTKKILLDESDIPDRWYNILPDMPGPPAPYLNPQTLLPMGPADLAPIFPQAIIAQEVSAEPWIEIPDQVREIYKIWRPSPLYRADRLEKVLDTPAHIYFKYEGV